MQKVHLLPPPPAQVAVGALIPIGVNDLSTAFEGEPRVQDTFLAERLGFKRLFDIRDLIKRNADEMKLYGALVRQVGGQPNYPCHTGNSPQPEGNSTASARRGPKGHEYWLNEGQALLVCALARTTAAARVRRELITVFMEVRHGRVIPAIHIEPQVADIARMGAMLERLQADVTKLRNQMGGLFGRLDEQGKVLEQASKRAATKLISSRIVAGPITPPAALLYGVTAIATYLNLTARQTQFLIDTGRIPAQRLGKRVVCTTAGLDKWMADMSADRKGVRQ